MAAIENNLTSEPTERQPVSKKVLWTGRIISAVPVLMLLLSAVMKLLKPAPVLQGFVQARLSGTPHFDHRNPRAPLHAYLSNSAHLCFGRDFAHWLSRRRGRLLRAHRRSILFRPGRPRCARVGGTFPSRSTPACAHSSARVTLPARTQTRSQDDNNHPRQSGFFNNRGLAGARFFV